MKVLGVIPARFGSTRLPAKPLLKINGRPLLEWVIRGVKEAQLLSELIVATDHSEIAAVADSLGVRAIMTAPDLPSGSDRVWAAAKSQDCDIVLNIQGDEPLVQPFWIDRLVELFHDSTVQMGTLAHDLPADELDSKNSVKVVLNQYSDAIYFSRFAIPYSREGIEKYPALALKHIGLYGYKKDFLQKFCEQGPTSFERAESLEQLRAMWMGAKIKVAKLSAHSIGVDTTDDIQAVERVMEQEKWN